MIDGIDALAAAWEYAGILGLWPVGMTLRRLWIMVEGRNRQTRVDQIQLANLVWGIGEIDLLSFMVYGSMAQTPKGVESLPDETQEQLRKKIKEMQSDPNAPKWKQAE